MSTEVKFRRGTTAQHSTFTGALGELTVDTDRDEPVIHDAVLAGGHRVPGAKAIQNEEVVYATDTGVADAYAIAPSPAISAYVEGQRFAFKAANANTGASTLAVSGLATKSIKKTDGATDLASGDIAASQVVVVVFDGTNFQITSAAGAAGGGITLGTEQSTSSGSSKVFSGIPAGTKRITVNLIGIITVADAQAVSIRLGDAGGLEATGYNAGAMSIGTFKESTTEFPLNAGGAGDRDPGHGSIVLNLEDDSDNTWTLSGTMASPVNNDVYASAGSKSLSAELTQIELLLTTSTFNGGVVNISYE